jgi:hypothetical protein
MRPNPAGQIRFAFSINRKSYSLEKKHMAGTNPAMTVQ